MCASECGQMESLDFFLDHFLGEIDQITQDLMEASLAEVESPSDGEESISFGFTDLSECLDEMEEQDLDALVDDLRSKIPQIDFSACEQSSTYTNPQTATAAPTQDTEPAAPLPPSPNTREPGTKGPSQVSEAQTKAEKIKLALEKLKEANVRKLIIKVWMSDGGSKVLMVDERQTVRDVLDKLFEKSYCDGNISWGLRETNTELGIERTFEDHESLVESLSAWTRNSKNKIHFTLNHQRYVMFRNPQLFYMSKKKKVSFARINKATKEFLIQESFCGSTLIVPDLEGVLFLKENGKKVWKPRYFVLRASGLYYVPKGKTKSCMDLACFTRYENVNVHTVHTPRDRYRAPTDFCFILKHPYIQKESNDVKFLCCQDEHKLLLWVNTIRIAKYGVVLYKNYQAALQRASSQQPQPFTVATDSDDYSDELPPDFIPPPPPHYVTLI